MMLMTLDQMKQDIELNILSIEHEQSVCLSCGEYESHRHLETIKSHLVEAKNILDNSIIMQHQLLPKGSTITINQKGGG